MTTTALDDVSTDDDRASGPGTIGSGRGYALLLVITGALGLLAAWVITLDKFELLKDPNYKPACSLNPIISCGNIMQSKQAEVFGFPNPVSRPGRLRRGHRDRYGPAGRMAASAAGTGSG